MHTRSTIAPKSTTHGQYTQWQHYITIHRLKCCLDLWHSCGLARQPADVCPRTTNTYDRWGALWPATGHYTSPKSNYLERQITPVGFAISPPQQAPATVGVRFNTSHRCKWQSCQAHETTKKEAVEGDLDMIGKRGIRRVQWKDWEQFDKLSWIKTNREKQDARNKCRRRVRERGERRLCVFWGCCSSENKAPTAWPGASLRGSPPLKLCLFETKMNMFKKKNEISHPECFWVDTVQ